MELRRSKELDIDLVRELACSLWLSEVDGRLCPCIPGIIDDPIDLTACDRRGVGDAGGVCDVCIGNSATAGTPGLLIRRGWMEGAFGNGGDARSDGLLGVCCLARVPERERANRGPTSCAEGCRRLGPREGSSCGFFGSARSCTYPLGVQTTLLTKTSSCN